MIDIGWNRDFALEQAGDDELMLAELLELLRQSSAEDLNQIREGLRTGRAEAVGQAAHSIKGAAASLGLEKLSQLAYEMEKAGMAGDLLSIAGQLPHLETMLQQLADL